MKHTAYILYTVETDMHMDTVDITENDVEFKHGEYTYKIRDRGKFTFKRIVFEMWKRIMPWPKSILECRSYYKAGEVEPLGWTPPEATKDGVAFWAEDLYNAAIEKTHWANLFKIGGGRGGIMGYLLIGILIVGGLIGFFIVMPMLTGGGFI